MLFPFCPDVSTSCPFSVLNRMAAPEGALRAIFTFAWAGSTCFMRADASSDRALICAGLQLLPTVARMREIAVRTEAIRMAVFFDLPAYNSDVNSLSLVLNFL